MEIYIITGHMIILLGSPRKISVNGINEITEDDNDITGWPHCVVSF